MAVVDVLLLLREDSKLQFNESSTAWAQLAQFSLDDRQE